MIDRKDDYLDHIKQAIDDVLGYVDELNFDDFLNDKRTQQACIMNLIIMGEAATKLMNEYSEFTEQNSQIPWRAMRGMRNRIAHGYFNINLAVVWETIQTALPNLMIQMQDLSKNN